MKYWKTGAERVRIQPPQISADERRSFFKNSETDPRGRANGPSMNPPLDGGNLPRLFRHFRTGGTSRTEPFLRVKPPVHLNIGSNDGNHPAPALQAGYQG